MGKRVNGRGRLLAPALLLLASCAPLLSGDALSRQIQRDPARGVYIAGVPFFPQEPERCGPAALAMVMAFRGRPVPPDLIASEIYLPDLKGTLTVDLLLYPRTQGFESRIHEGGFPSLLRELRQGNPVIVLIDAGLPLTALRHYAVVVGYDAGTESVIAHSGRMANMILPRELFEMQWRASGNWGLVVSKRDGSQPGP
ncbi:MAG: hypothetical protein A2V83_01255 [Nitrospirae bacterium RBG_16_64_22]|nr:MAG: hypothetical protein A2V83_01255 [Nitrospirae bacterium RBG_16_64_22]